MASIKEKAAAARAKHTGKVVSVVLDGELSDERDKLLAEIESMQTQAAGRLSGKADTGELEARLDALAVAAEDALEHIRVSRLPGNEWSTITSHHPVRVDVPIDRHYGYDFDAVCEAALRHTSANGTSYAHRLVGEDKESVNPEDWEPLTEEDWDELAQALSGSEWGSLRDAVWTLNEYEPQQRINALVKGSGAALRSASK